MWPLGNFTIHIWGAGLIVSAVSVNLIQIGAPLWPISDHTHHRLLSAHPLVLWPEPQYPPQLRTFVHADLSLKCSLPHPQLGDQLSHPLADSLCGLTFNKSDDELSLNWEPVCWRKSFLLLSYKLFRLIAHFSHLKNQAPQVGGKSSKSW